MKKLVWLTAGGAVVAIGLWKLTRKSSSDAVDVEVTDVKGLRYIGLGATYDSLIEHVASQVSCPAGYGKQVWYARTGLFLGKYKWQVLCLDANKNPVKSWYFVDAESEPVEVTP